MHKIISSDFEIDLSTYKISIVEENSWFSDKYFTKYSFPFEFHLTDELNNKMGDLLSIESYSSRKYFEVKYQFYDRIEKAILLIEDIHNKTIKCSLKYGIDEIPGADIFLPDLGLEKHSVNDIYTHARQIVSKDYPETNYNFPMIYTDKYSPEEPMFNHFQNILNINHPLFGFYPNYVNDDDEMINYNIVHPLVYLLYVLKKGFANSGLTVTGDIVEDDLLKRVLLFCPKDYFQQTESSDDLHLSISKEDAEPQNPESDIFPLQFVEKEVIVPLPGKYNVIGEYKIMRPGISAYSAIDGYLKIEINGILVKFVKIHSVFTYNSGSLYLDFVVPINEPNTSFKVTVQTYFNEYEAAVDLEILPLYYLDENGNKMTGLINANEVDLNRAVPNITFGNFVTNILTQFNYSIDKVIDNKIHINRINSSMRENEVIDLTDFENIDMKRKPKYDIDFHFKYDAEGEMELPGIYINSNEFTETTKDFKKDVENTIQFKSFPLQPFVTDLGFLTVDGSVGSDDKMYFVLYKGVTNPFEEYSVPQDPTELNTMNIINNYHAEWISNRVQASEFTFSFIGSIEQLVSLDTKKRGYAYNQIHLFKSINKTEIAPGMFEVEIESENLVL